jgi:hypothetical protein
MIQKWMYKQLYLGMGFAQSKKVDLHLIYDWMIDRLVAKAVLKSKLSNQKLHSIAYHFCKTLSKVK